MATKSLEQQISEAKTRAMKARIEIDSTNSAPDGSCTKVTSERDARVTYTVARNHEGVLACDCEARVVCKHIGLALLTGIEYHIDPMALAVEARVKAFRFLDAYLASVPAAQEAPAAVTLAAQMADYYERLHTANEAAMVVTEATLAAQPFAGYDIVGEALRIVNKAARRQQRDDDDQWGRYQDARRAGEL